MIDKHPPIRIVLVTANYYNNVDGVSLTVNQLVSYLLKIGVELRVLCPYDPKPYIKPVKQVYPLASFPIPGRPERIAIGLTKPAKQLLSEFKPDVIHITTPDILGYQSLKFAIKNDIKVLTTYHTHFISYLKYFHLSCLSDLMWYLYRKFYNKTDIIYSPSHTINKLLKQNGITTPPISIWKRGIDTSLFNPNKRTISWRKKNGIDSSTFIVLYASRVVWEKNIKTLARVFQKLHQINAKKIISIVAGEGNAKKKLQQMIPNTLFTGHLDHEELAHYYANSDVFVFPSTTETIGNVILEALASGLPCIVPDVGFEYVESNYNGFRVSTFYESEYIAKIMYLYRNREHQKKMRENARKSILNTSWDRTNQQMLNNYLTLAKKKTSQLPNKKTTILNHT